LLAVQTNQRSPLMERKHRSLKGASQRSRYVGSNTPNHRGEKEVPTRGRMDSSKSHSYVELRKVLGGGGGVFGGGECERGGGWWGPSRQLYESWVKGTTILLLTRWSDMGTGQGVIRGGRVGSAGFLVNMQREEKGIIGPAICKRKNGLG